jgi:hypothetical protein
MAASAIMGQLELNGWSEVLRWVSTHEPEGVHLDFKRRSKGHTEDSPAQFDIDELGKIAKALSAFSNVEGGVLVYGVVATAAKKGEQDRAQSIESFPMVEAVAADLERRINSLTDPPVPGVRVRAIEDPSTPGQGVVAVYAPASDGGPHRAARGAHADRYFVRSTSNSDIASHAILAALFGRQPPPVLHLAFATDPEGFGVAYLVNAGRGIADAACVRLSLSLTTGSDVFDARFGPGAGWENHPVSSYRGAPSYRRGLRSFQTIYPDDTVTLLNFDRVDRDASLRVLARIDARHAQPVVIDEVVQLDAGNLVRAPAR